MAATMSACSCSSSPSTPPSSISPSSDVAIIGLACRTSGGCTSPSSLWDLLLSQKHGGGTVPAHRWEPWLRRDARNAREVAQTLDRGYFIPDLEKFDAAFFGISPKEAEQMDPHQRLALELSWEALEHAGVDPKRLAGSDTAVFMGVDSDDYSRLLLEDMANIEAWMGIGTAAHGVANRVSYHLDLMGPSSAVDAACASSGVAIHMGRQAILSGESSVALVGGVNVLLAPALTRMLGKAGALSPDGLCRSFDDGANGYARGEGGAVIVLKALSRALADGDRVLATLRGSAIAQDGKTNGIMAPNAKAQELVGRLALQRAGIAPESVGYVEAHATATALGDPTEVSAIAAIYGADRPADAPCYIGSIKPNVGHLEAGAGAIGLVKAVLAVHKGQLAPQALLSKLSSRIDWANSGLAVVRETQAWPAQDGPRRAAVCSYGYGGTVSHLVIEQHEAEAEAVSVPSEPQPGPVVLPLSAMQERRLAQQAGQLAAWLADQGEGVDLHAVANTLAQRRAHHDYRAAFVASSPTHAVSLLSSFASGTATDAITSRALAPASTVWVFSGHGAQWPAMGRDLVTNGVFLGAIAGLDAEAGFDAVAALATGDFGTTERVQILTFLVQVGLARVLMAHGVYPQAVIGHSVGEIAASVVAGCITADEGAMIVTRRAKLYATVPPGGMALVTMPFGAIQQELEGRTDLVAAIDASPSTCVVSGDASAVDAYMASLKQRNVKALRVKTDVGFHSPMLSALDAPLRQAISSIDPRPAAVPIYSTSQADPRSAALRHVDYWVNNMISPVHLRSAVDAAAEDGLRVFVEVSTHPIVLHSVNETLLERGLDDDDMATVAVMKRNTPADTSILDAVARLYVKGAPLDFGALLDHRHAWCPSVPGTPWVHKPYYKQVSTPALARAQTHDVLAHTVLGSRTAVAGTDTVLFSTTLSEANKPFPLTHPLDGTEIIPAAVYIATFLQATGARSLTDLQLRVPVAMGPEERRVQVAVQRGSVGLASSSASAEDETWVAHSTAQWNRQGDVGAAGGEAGGVDLDAARRRIGARLSDSFSVDYLASIGVAGIAFPWRVDEHWGNDAEMLARVDMDPSVETLPWDQGSWAPLLDAATSIGSTIFHQSPKLRIVSHIDRVDVLSRDAPPKVGYIHVEAAADAKGLASHVNVLSQTGQVLARFRSMRFSDVEGAAGVSGSVESLVHRLAWVPPKFAEKARPLGRVVLVCRNEALREAYRRQIKTNVVCVSRGDELAAMDVLEENATVVYVPDEVPSIDAVHEATEEFIWETTSLVKLLSHQRLSCKLFVLTSRVHAGSSPTGLAHGALYGLGRIIAAEHPDLWGGLFDLESPEAFPLLAVKYAQGHDVLRVVDGMPLRAVMRPLTKEQRHPRGTLLPRPEGTYVITGGLGDLGLETCAFLVEKGARRVVLLSRRGLPPRREWPLLIEAHHGRRAAMQRILDFEKLGATVYAVALDIAAPGAAEALHTILDTLSLPPVLGVVHAAGVLEDSLLADTSRDSFARVLAPKVRGALALHAAFPPGTLDFFMLYSSIGQLVGTAGQASYAAGNAFLDAVAVHRRARGDNALAVQWSAWRALGMATATGFITAELQSKGCTDITRDEAFRAWEHVSRYDVESVVVTRCLPIDADETPALPLLDDVVVRRPRPLASSSSSSSHPTAESSAPADNRPSDPEELKVWLDLKIRECIAGVLMMPDVQDVDARTPVADLGVDSVMTVALRQKLQAALKVKVPPTLTWNYPTVAHLVPWFMDKMKEGN